MQFETLAEWLDYLATLHRYKMELGLERVKAVAGRLHLLAPSCPVIIVGGTNGKGSTVAGLEAVYLAAGYRVGAFTSPYLFRHNETVRIQGQTATDEAFCQAFAQIEQARGDISLTPFEFNTLAALFIFKSANLNLYLLEVGLGGRLDAVNIIDADVSIVTSIGIDHVDWLGHTRELIAKEKAGIFRPAQLAVCGDFSPPQTLLDHAVELGTRLFCQQQDFSFSKNEDSWSWRSNHNDYQHLPLPQLALQNMSTVLMAVELLQQKLPVTTQAIEQALQNVTLAGRIQVVSGEITQIIDVSHNPASAQFLAEKLALMPCQGKTKAVFSMLADKDIVGTLAVMKNHIDEWHIAELNAERCASLEKLTHAFSQAGIENRVIYPDVQQAYQTAMRDSHKGDRVIVFGSFYTVANIERVLKAHL